MLSLACTHGQIRSYCPCVRRCSLAMRSLRLQRSSQLQLRDDIVQQGAQIQTPGCDGCLCAGLASSGSEWRLTTQADHLLSSACWPFAELSHHVLGVLSPDPYPVALHNLRPALRHPCLCLASCQMDNRCAVHATPTSLCCVRLSTAVAHACSPSGAQVQLAPYHFHQCLIAALVHACSPAKRTSAAEALNDPWLAAERAEYDRIMGQRMVAQAYVGASGPHECSGWEAAPAPAALPAPLCSPTGKQYNIQAAKDGWLVEMPSSGNAAARAPLQQLLGGQPGASNSNPAAMAAQPASWNRPETTAGGALVSSCA